MKPFFSSIFSTITEPSVFKVLSLSSVSALCVQLAPVVSVIAGLLAIGYGLYKWIRDMRNHTCNKDACPYRTLPGDLD